MKDNGRISICQYSVANHIRLLSPIIYRDIGYEDADATTSQPTKTKQRFIIHVNDHKYYTNICLQQFPSYKVSDIKQAEIGNFFVFF